jgi:hypothetical protein
MLLSYASRNREQCLVAVSSQSRRLAYMSDKPYHSPTPTRVYRRWEPGLSSSRTLAFDAGRDLPESCWSRRDRVVRKVRPLLVVAVWLPVRRGGLEVEVEQLVTALVRPGQQPPRPPLCQREPGGRLNSL